MIQTVKQTVNRKIIEDAAWIVSVLAAVAAIVYVAGLLGFEAPSSEAMISAIRGSGSIGPVISVAIMTLHGLLPIPIEAASAVNGIVFGVWYGAALTWGGLMLAAWTGYGVARMSGGFARRILPENRLQKAGDWVEDGGWWKLLLARQLPFVSFWAMNLALGVLKVSFLRFTWTTALGNVPYALGISFLSGYFV